MTLYSYCRARSDFRQKSLLLHTGLFYMPVKPYHDWQHPRRVFLANTQTRHECKKKGLLQLEVRSEDWLQLRPSVNYRRSKTAASLIYEDTTFRSKDACAITQHPSNAALSSRADRLHAWDTALRRPFLSVFLHFSIKRPRQICPACRLVWFRMFICCEWCCVER